MLTARLADHAAEVIAIEESPYAVRLGELNMQLNGCGNVSYRRGRVEDAVPGLEGNVDVLVLDPPRAGSAEAAIEAMAILRPQRIVYISYAVFCLKKKKLKALPKARPINRIFFLS